MVKIERALEFLNDDAIKCAPDNDSKTSNRLKIPHFSSQNFSRFSFLTHVGKNNLSTLFYIAKFAEKQRHLGTGESQLGPSSCVASLTIPITHIDTFEYFLKQTLTVAPLTNIS